MSESFNCTEQMCLVAVEQPKEDLYSKVHLSIYVVAVSVT